MAMGGVILEFRTGILSLVDGLLAFMITIRDSWRVYVWIWGRGYIFVGYSTYDV
jgi:hypothetical protein